MSKLIDALDQASLRTDLPSFRPGDSVKVHVKVTEGNRSRLHPDPGTADAEKLSLLGSATLIPARGQPC